METEPIVQEPQQPSRNESHDKGAKESQNRQK